MLEDEVIDSVCIWLKKDSWNIDDVCKGRKRGIDIKASKGNKILYVEAKGAKGNKILSHVTRDKFDSGQLKTHLGVAILKSLTSRNKEPKVEVAIAIPDNEYISGILSEYIPYIKKMGIEFLWVKENGNVKRG